MEHVLKRDDVRSIFPDATDEQVSALLNTIGGELNPLKANVADLTGKLEGAQADLATAHASEAELRGKVDDLTTRVQAGMSAEELLAQREQAAVEREREFTMKSNGLDARGVLMGAGLFNEEEVARFTEQVTSEDAEATRARAQAIVDAAARVRKQAEADAKAALLKSNPTLTGGTATGPTTVGEFLKLPYSEQLALKQADPEILTRLKRD